MKLLTSLVIVMLATPLWCGAEEDLVDKKAAKIPDYVKNTMYAGYLDVSEEKKFYYWFFHKDTKAEKAPVLLWLNGGPGCSSLMGAGTENGPFQFNDGAVGFKPEENQYAWTKLANVIYLESPGGVGYSIGTKSGPITDYQTGVDNKDAIVSFFKKFPEFAHNDFYIAGESYAGTYIPYTVDAIHTANQNGANIPLQGWAIGNGCTDPTECVASKLKFQGDSSVYIYDFLYNQNKFSEATHKEFVKYCNDDPNGKDCQNVRGNIQVETGLVSQNQSLGSLINPYDLYAYCFHEKDTESTYSPFRNMMKNLVAVKNSSLPRYDSIPPCADAIGALKYFREPEVMKAIHVDPKAEKWTMCSDDVGQRYASALNASYWVYPKLVGQYKILIFSGDTDSVVPITGTLHWVEKLRKELSLELKEPWRPWFFPGDKPKERQVGGFALEFDKDFTFVSVRGVGHMVPQWGPKKAFQMIKSYLYEDTYPKK